MKFTARFTIVLAAAALVAACDTGQADQLENQIILMQDRLIELESQVAESQEQLERLASSVTQMDAYVQDVEKAVIDLSMYVPRDLLVNVEATVGNAKTKVTEVRERTNALVNALGTME